MRWVAQVTLVSMAKATYAEAPQAMYPGTYQRVPPKGYLPMSKGT